MPPPAAVIFDMDGTLVQTRIASFRIFREVSHEFDLGVEDPETFYDIFRDNLFVALRRICRDEAQAQAVKDAFYARLERQYEPSMVPGMVAVVRTLASHCPLCVLSGNSMAVIRRILVQNELSLCFSHVFGGDVAESKHAAIEQFLADTTSGYGRLCQGAYAEEREPTRVDPAATVLVTDTVGDVREAGAAGIRAVGVSWGMHTAEELTTAGAEFVALWPQELLSHLLGSAASQPPAPTCAIPGTSAATAPGGCADCPCGGTCASSARPTVDARTSAAADVRRARRTAGAAGAHEAAAAARTAQRFTPTRTADAIASAVRATCS